MPFLTLGSTMERLLLSIRAGHPVIYIVSHEETRVLDFLAKAMRLLLLKDPQKTLLRWDQSGVLGRLTNLEAAPEQDETTEDRDWFQLTGLPSNPDWKNIQREPDPGVALDMISKGNYVDLKNSLTVFFDVHQRLGRSAHLSMETPLVRPLRNAAKNLRAFYEESRSTESSPFPYKTIVVVAPSAQDLSMELEKDIIRLDFPLPDQEELRVPLREMVESKVFKFSTDTDIEPEALRDLVAAAGRGLTLEAFKLGLNAFAVRGDKLHMRHIEDMLDLKAHTIRDRALDYTPHVEVNLGGLEPIKKWVKSRCDLARYESIRKRFALPPLKGVMLCGVSGGGKSMLAKLIAKEFNLALLRMDVGALFGSYIGESEERTRNALRLAEVLAPVVLWLDEVEKAFSGIHGGGDNGVSARVFGSFLTWLAEKKDSVFVVATANDHTKILEAFPEFGRKGRFDEIFWVDLPGQAARRRIFEIYLKRLDEHEEYSLPNAQQVDQLATTMEVSVSDLSGGSPLARLCDLLSQPRLSENLTGAEIEQAVKECTYEFYNLSESERNSGLAVGELVAKTVQAAKDRALYKVGSRAHEKLEELRQDARMQGWPFVDGEDA